MAKNGRSAANQTIVYADLPPVRIKGSNDQELADAGIWFGPMHVPGHQGRQHVKLVRCGRCPEQLPRVDRDGKPADVILKSLANAGWTVGRAADEHRCPACSRPARLKPEPEPALAGPAVVVHAQVRGPAPPPPRAQAQAVLLIGQHFAETAPEQGQYRAGWSDGKVAEALAARGVALSPEAVGEIRRQGFGTLDAASAYDELAAEVGLIAEEMAALHARAGDGLGAAEGLYRDEIRTIKADARAAVALAREQFQASFAEAQRHLSESIETIVSDSAARITELETRYADLKDACGSAMGLFTDALERIEQAKAELAGETPAARRRAVA